MRKTSLIIAEAVAEFVYVKLVMNIFFEKPTGVILWSPFFHF